jgi:uncharacterized protein (TIGR00369 family)
MSDTPVIDQLSPGDQEAGRELARRLATEIPHGCALAEAGIEPVVAHQGVVLARMCVQERHLNQVGSVQGGVYATLADAAAGFGAMSLLADSRTFVTLEMRIHLLRGVRAGEVLLAEAEPVHAGRTTMTFQVRLLREGDELRKPVAFFTCTQLVMERS